MNNYTVIWRVEVQSDSPVGAAAMARLLQLDPNPGFGWFTVLGPEGHTTVDLEDLEVEI